MIDFTYILAASHSGSTLLTMVLASHPRIASVGETSAVLWRGKSDSATCSCGTALSACAFWAKVREGMARRGADWESPTFQTDFRLRGRRWTDRVLRAEHQGRLLEAVRDAALAASPAWRRESPAIFGANRALIETVCGLKGTTVFLDSSKEPHRLKFLMRIPGLRVRVIQLVRDGRGVAASYLRRNEFPIERACDEWRRSLVSEEHLLRRLPPERALRVRYEDFCRDAAGWSRRIFEFMNVDAGHDVSRFHLAEHHILGNRMRLSATGDIRLDEKWRREMTPAMLEVFERTCGGINRRYGYA
ncbi:MAG: sulfotransferase [Phycisphaerae bacterium]|nr:MAG: sulfotransferase [Planctomycetota bacterium]KAB2944729.1 MAG: sulfotransferase [Phycisphaerae bacterium]MBE7456766.1 sulfotransferase [Planctomycetia bacterium]MCK6464215.1 sulfotransferase [Phycisphaerae bacterium]MCL4717806.1 sulfotransferase [Phycisphaerae bacterium]